MNRECSRASTMHSICARLHHVVDTYMSRRVKLHLVHRAALLIRSLAGLALDELLLFLAATGILSVVLDARIVACCTCQL